MDDLLAQALKKARRISRDEIIEANIRMFEDMGLDLEDVETMAKSVGLDVEDLLQFDTHISVGSTCPASDASHSGRVDEEAKDLSATVAAIDGKIDEIRDLLVQQRDSSLRKEWYSVVEAADLTGFKPYTIRQCCNTGRIRDDWKSKDLRSGKWRISVEAVRWIQNHGLPSAN